MTQIPSQVLMKYLTALSSIVHNIFTGTRASPRTKWLARITLTGVLALTMVAATTNALAKPIGRTIPNDLTGSADPPFVILDSANDLTVFEIKSDHQVWYRAQSCPGCGWNGWTPLGGLYAESMPVAAMDGYGVLHVFEIGKIGSGIEQLYHIYTNCSGCAWGGWTALTNYPTPLYANTSVGVNYDGRVEVFINHLGHVFHIWQTCQCNPIGFSDLSDFQLSGDFAADLIGVGQDLDGRLEVFAVDSKSNAWLRYQTSPGCCWSGWGSFDTGDFPSMAVGRNQDGRLEVFVTHTDKAVWHRSQTCAGCGWSGWSSLGGSFSGLGIEKAGVGRNQDGRLEIFLEGTNNHVYHRWQTCAGCGWSSGWSDLGGSVQSNIAVGQDSDGRLEVFATGTGYDLQSNYQSSPNCCWHGWYSLGK